MAATSTLNAGTGPDSLVLKISQDAYQRDAQYTVSVDGKQVGGTFTASASHAAKQSDTLTLKGDWAAGAHKVSVKFLNDAWGGTAATDRNLHVDSATYNGKAVAGAAQVVGDDMDAGRLLLHGRRHWRRHPARRPGLPRPRAAGSDTLVLKISQDAYKGSAQYTVSVDGKQIGGTFTASASHAAGQSDTLTLKGDWGAGAHKVSVKFLNDKFGGTAATDRNLHIDAATYNGEELAGVEQMVAGTAKPGSFGFTEAAEPQPEPEPEPETGSGQFRETFFDGFDGTALDRSKWTITYGGDGLYWNNAFRWNNSELSVSDGNAPHRAEQPGRRHLDHQRAFDHADLLGAGLRLHLRQGGDQGQDVAGGGRGRAVLPALAGEQRPLAARDRHPRDAAQPGHVHQPLGGPERRGPVRGHAVRPGPQPVARLRPRMDAGPHHDVRRRRRR